MEKVCFMLLCSLVHRKKEGFHSYTGALCACLALSLLWHETGLRTCGGHSLSTIFSDNEPNKICLQPIQRHGKPYIKIAVRQKMDRFPRSILITLSFFRQNSGKINETGGLCSSHDDERVPFCRLQSPFSYGNRAPWNADASSADKFSTYFSTSILFENKVKSGTGTGPLPRPSGACRCPSVTLWISVYYTVKYLPLSSTIYSGLSMLCPHLVDKAVCFPDFFIISDFHFSFCLLFDGFHAIM